MSTPFLDYSIALVSVNLIRKMKLKIPIHLLLKLFHCDLSIQANQLLRFSTLNIIQSLLFENAKREL